MQGWITDPKADKGMRLADDLPEPEPKDDEVVIDVRAFSVNRGELTLVRIRPDGFRPGQDISGVVVRSIEGGPTVGSRVVAIVDWHGWSERVAAPAIQVGAIPDNVSFAQACTLPVAGLTAIRALAIGGNLLGRNVLVTGATGGVGQFAVQLAVAAGTHVTAQVSGEQRFDEARGLGAERVVTAVDDTCGPFAHIFEGVGGQMLIDSLHRLEPNGSIALYGTLGGKAQIELADFRSAPGSRIMPMFLRNNPGMRIGDELALMASLIGDGRLKPLIGLSLDWTRTPEGLVELTDRNVRGKAVFTRE